MSSPKEQKIVYIEIKNLKAYSPHYDWPVKPPRVSPLIDAGLTTPMGIAIDRTHGYIYVADLDASSIFRYKFFVADGQFGEKRLVSDGVQLTVVNNREARWCSCDIHGNLYFTDQSSNSVFKLDYATIEELASEKFGASDLQTVAEAEEEELAQAEAAEKLAKSGNNMPQTPPPPPKPIIHILYEKTENPNVMKPSGVATNGVNLFWANEKGGDSAGSVVEGEVHPIAPPVSGGEDSEGAPLFTTRQLAGNSQAAFGVALTPSFIIYGDETQNVYGVKYSGGQVTTFTNKIQAPRGLAFDGDATAYVADQGSQAVYSFPCGILAPVGISRIVGFHDVFGLAILNENDPAWHLSPKSAANSLRLLSTFIACVIISLFA
jgi:DNA-binding beta-propeller fold protein YncE